MSQRQLNDLLSVINDLLSVINDLLSVIMDEKTMKRNLLVLALLLLLPLAAQAQWVLMKTDADKAVRAGIDYIYNLEFENASTQFQYVISTYPDHPVGYFMDAMVDWWKMDTDYRNQTDELKGRFLGKIDKVISVCDRLLEQDENDIVGLFFKGGAIGYRALYVDYVQGSGNTLFQANILQHGPVIGVSAKF